MLPTDWLFEPTVPPIYFIVALLTAPHTWASRARQLVNNYVLGEKPGANDEVEDAGSEKE